MPQLGGKGVYVVIENNQEPNEKILWFDRQILSRHELAHKTIFDDEKLWETILENVHYSPRKEVEEKNTLKQLVAYVLIKAGDLYLTYRRSQRSGEKKLRDRRSIGIGGHLNVVDRSQSILETNENRTNMDFVINGVWREINEEVEIRTGFCKPYLCCFINDDSNIVGVRHFGVVWFLEINEPKVFPRGRGVADISFHGVDYLVDHRNEFESWSQLIIDNLLQRK